MLNIWDENYPKAMFVNKFESHTTQRAFAQSKDTHQTIANLFIAIKLTKSIGYVKFHMYCLNTVIQNINIPQLSTVHTVSYTRKNYQYKYLLTLASGKSKNSSKEYIELANKYRNTLMRVTRSKRV